jgi:hypothetical protein
MANLSDEGQFVLTGVSMVEYAAHDRSSACSRTKRLLQKGDSGAGHTLAGNLVTRVA